MEQPKSFDDSQFKSYNNFRPQDIRILEQGREEWPNPNDGGCPMNRVEFGFGLDSGSR